MSTRTFLEVEKKFAVSDAAIVPDLTRINHVAAIADTKDHNLSAIYYDTADLRLTRSKITLRRREGGDDDGWHIKLPSEQGRIEIHAELTDPVDGEVQVPEELQAVVRSLVRREKLVPIAQVDNHRIVTIVADAEGTPLAEFSDDHVTAFSFLPSGGSTRWREWEFELTEEAQQSEYAQDLIHSATSQLVSAGARVSTSPSKLVMALGSSTEGIELPPFLQRPDVDPDSPIAAVVSALQVNRDKLLAYDPKVRRDEWDSVHQMRVATRELRSHMETFNGILGGEELLHLEDELKLLAQMLGVARDAEVVEERFHSLLDMDDTGVLDETTAQHLRDDMSTEYRRAHRRVVATLNSPRYMELLDRLDEVLAHPPVPSAQAELDTEPAANDDSDSNDATTADSAVAEAPAEGDAGEQDAESDREPTDDSDDVDFEHPNGDLPIDALLFDHLAVAYKKLIKRHKKAVDNWHNPELTLHEREDYFHAMRKSAKKLRYAAEAAGAATDLKTKRIYKACKDLQSTLGDFQDSVTSRDKIVAMAEKARRRGEDTFGYGVVYQRELAIGLQALDEYADGVKAIKSAYKALEKQAKELEKTRAKKAEKEAKKARKAAKEN